MHATQRVVAKRKRVIMVSKMKIMGYSPHARESRDTRDLRETGWLFCRLADQRLIARVEFGKVHMVHFRTFDAYLTSAALNVGMDLHEVASSTTVSLEVADFVTSDEEVAKAFLADGVDLIDASMYPSWTACQLAQLLIASRLCGEFEPVPSKKTRPIL